MNSISLYRTWYSILLGGLVFLTPLIGSSTTDLDSLLMKPHPYFGFSSHDLSNDLLILKEGNTEHSIDEIRKMGDLFTSNNDLHSIDPNATYWVRFTLYSHSPTTDTILAELGRERISTWQNAKAFIYHADTLVSTQVTGISLPPSEKSVRNALNLIKIIVYPGTNTIYCRLNGHYRISDNSKWKTRYNYFTGNISFYIHNDVEYFAQEAYKYPGHFEGPKRGFIFSNNYFKQIIEVVDDPDGSYDLHYIISNWDQKATYLYDDFPQSDHTYWLRFKVISTQESTHHLMGLSSGTHWNFDRAEIYTTDDQRITSTQIIGNDVKFSEKTNESAWNVFRVDAPAGDTSTIFMKLTGAGKRFVPEFGITHIEETTFWSRIFNVQLIYGAFFGILIVQVFYFFILGFIEKESLHFWFVCLIVGFGLALGFVGGDVNFFIFPAYEEYHPWLTGLGVFMMVLGLYKYLDIFLSLRDIFSFNPNRVLTPLLVIHGFICFLFAYSLESIGGNIAVFEYYFQLLFGSCIFNFLVGISLGIYAWIRGSRDAKFFVGAFAALVIIFVIRLIFAFGSFDGQEGFQQDTILIGLYIHYVLFFGIILTIILLGFSNGYRINRLKTAQMQSSVRIQETQKVNQILSEKNKLIETRSAEKDFLLKEVHHRVRNNLQILSSLLSLQSDSEKDNSIINALQEGRNRVDAIGLIHQHLYSQELLESIDMSIYLDDLCTYLTESFENEKQDIKIIPDVSVHTADVETAIPIGLIVNELVTNSIKYAFTNMSEGIIDVQLNFNKNNLLELTVKDNGNSQSSTSAKANSTQFGSRLVTLLSQKLKGDITIDTSHGYSTTIVFQRYNCK